MNHNFCGPVTHAQTIATVAHGATGQKRRDGSPYIRHPRRVAELVAQFAPVGPAGGNALVDCIAAAWLHDVVEDTELDFVDLLNLGVSPQALRIVELLTKPDNNPAGPEYYARIAGSDLALFVKCADRCANLEDAHTDLVNGVGFDFATKYVAKTKRDVLPLFEAWPHFAAELRTRISKIEALLEKREIVQA